jgi:phytoene dehydrogenase-like protein
MTDIYLELAGKKAVAWSLEWPGWCRVRSNEEAAVQALIDYEPRYRLIAQRAGLDFAPGDLVVVERLPGDGNTAWGMPSVIAPVETQPIEAATMQRYVALLRAAWDMLEEVVATSPAELRKGPRGGGRDRDEVWRHVVEAERVYARRIGVQHKPFDVNDKNILGAMQEEIIAVLGMASTSEPPVAGRWNASYAIRRIAWHVTDHIWEIEDRRD